MSKIRFEVTTTPSTPPTDKVFVYIDESDNHIKTIDDTGTVTDLTDTTAYTDQEFADKVGGQTELTGVMSIEDIVSQNTDIKKIDITAFNYFIQGARYSYAGGTAISPTIGAGDSSTWVGVDSSGLLYSTSKFTSEQNKTILPLARLQAVQGQSGSGSDLQPPLHLTYSESQNGFVDREWVEGVIGALYQSGGTFSENATNALQVDQTSGSFHNAQRKHLDITGSSNIEASALYHVSGSPTVQTRATLIIPKYYDNGTDIVALGNNKYASHTLLRSPKADDVFFLVYSNAEYASQAGAEQAPIDYSVFVDQATSSLVPVARFILKGDSTNIITIIDERPSIGATQSAIIGTATMQQVYDNSTSPEITTDSTRGSLTVKEGTADDTADVFDGKNNAGTTTFSINGNGALRTSVTAEDNTIDFRTGTHFTLTATAAAMGTPTVTGCTGQEGTITITSSENITGWDGLYYFPQDTIPADLTGIEFFGYVVESETNIRIGRAQ